MITPIFFSRESFWHLIFDNWCSYQTSDTCKHKFPLSQSRSGRPRRTFRVIDETYLIKANIKKFARIDEWNCPLRIVFFFFQRAYYVTNGHTTAGPTTTSRIILISWRRTWMNVEETIRNTSVTRVLRWTLTSFSTDREEELTSNFMYLDSDMCV